jgi:hypothetical protein
MVAMVRMSRRERRRTSSAGYVSRRFARRNARKPCGHERTGPETGPPLYPPILTAGANSVRARAARRSSRFLLRHCRTRALRSSRCCSHRFVSPAGCPQRVHRPATLRSSSSSVTRRGYKPTPRIDPASAIEARRGGQEKMRGVLETMREVRNDFHRIAVKTGKSAVYPQCGEILGVLCSSE